MLSYLSDQLSSKNPFVRKVAAAALVVPKWWRGLSARPPVIANSFPKSGTHLLVQLVQGLPETVNFGAFLASMTSSFRFRERTSGETCRFIRRTLPGEIVRGH